MSKSQMGAPDRRTVLAFPSNLLGPMLGFQGFRPYASPFGYLFLDYLLARSSFVGKADAERDPTYKQIIPYCVVTCGDSVFAYRRAGSEGRLSDRVSIGIGGHVEPADFDAAKATVPEDTFSEHLHGALFKALRREMDEEAVFSSIASGPTIVGYINDDSDEVGRVHFGVVFHIEVSWLGWEAGPDDEIREGAFLTIDPIVLGSLRRFGGARMESWSSIATREWMLPKLVGVSSGPIPRLEG